MILYLIYTANTIVLLSGVSSTDYISVSEATTTVEPSSDMVCVFSCEVCIIKSTINAYMSQDWRERLAEMESDIKAKNLELAKREDDLKVSQQKKEDLTHEMTEIREEIEGAWRRIEELLQEKNTLESDLRRREVDNENLKLKNSSLVTAKEVEAANYQKQLESIRQELEAEKKKVSFLQEELQRKRVELAEKMKDIQYLTEARDRANFESERERDKAEQKSKELTAAAISHAARTAEFQVCVTCNLVFYMSVHYS